jgi:hypothetical protein
MSRKRRTASMSMVRIRIRLWNITQG